MESLGWVGIGEGARAGIRFVPPLPSEKNIIFIFSPVVVSPSKPKSWRRLWQVVNGVLIDWMGGEVRVRTCA